MKLFWLAIATFLIVTGCKEQPTCPSDVSPLYALLDSGKIADAETQLAAWKPDFPACSDLFYLQGMVWERKDSFGLAEKEYTEALRLNPPACPEQVAALSGRAWARIRRDQFAEAAADLNAAISMATCKEAQRTVTWLHYSLANCYAEMNQMTDALAELDSLIPKLNGQLPEALLLRAKVKLALDQPSEALSELQSDRLKGFHQNGTWQWQLGQCFRALNQADSACTHIQKAKELQHPAALRDTLCP